MLVPWTLQHANLNVWYFNDVNFGDWTSWLFGHESRVPASKCVSVLMYCCWTQEDNLSVSGISKTPESDSNLLFVRKLLLVMFRSHLINVFPLLTVQGTSHKQHSGNSIERTFSCFRLSWMLVVCISIFEFLFLTAFHWLCTEPVPWKILGKLETGSKGCSS